MHDLYSYDIKSCHYSLLKNLIFDVSDIEKNNKLKRNIQIGKMMKSNPRLTSLLNVTTNTIIEEFLINNKVTDDELILRQYDGIIVTRPLKKTQGRQMYLDLRSQLEVFISSFNRQMYIARDKNKIITKGIPNNYDKMKQIYEKIVKINFINKTSIFKNLQRIKNDFLSSNDSYLFAIPSGEKFIIFLKGYGDIEISKQTIKLMDASDIDKEKYFNMYVKPFTESLTFEFVR